MYSFTRHLDVRAVHTVPAFFVAVLAGAVAPGIGVALLSGDIRGSIYVWWSVIFGVPFGLVAGFVFFPVVLALRPCVD
jgi:hypothetical protein